jgi:hypothetical protein
MATSVTYIVKIDGDPKVIMQSFSDSPIIKDGTTIACFKVLLDATPDYSQASPDYNDGDTVVIQLDGAKSVLYAVCKKVNATAVIALTAGASTNPTGITLSTGTITTAVDLEFFIVYNVNE